MVSKLTIPLFFILGLFNLSAQQHPSINLTKDDVAEIRSSLGHVPMFDSVLNFTIKEIEQDVNFGVDVPVPADLAGGYTHERHKSNFFILQKAGLLYQITGEEKYARFIRSTLIKYAELYPTLSLHPVNKSYARGKLFWQCLNDANWLVYVSQAYDCIYEWLSQEDRELFNSKIFRPMADFLSVENPQFFNRIHNHSTWGNAAVGMIGLVMADDKLVDRALYGLENVSHKNLGEDNDGGLIYSENNRAGFLAQIDEAFSPDGYYTEGPYYQRYAMYPFLIFAQALSNNRPDLEIFNYRDKVLEKAIYALINLTNNNGEFFPINDAQKGMSYHALSVVAAVDLVYNLNNDPSLLSIAKEQHTITLDKNGFSVAKGIAENRMKPYFKPSIQLTDGALGEGGAIGILRSYNQTGETSILMKYGKHGMGHGHFDKLSFCYYLGGEEIIQDYGAARWVNIEQKDGGGYLNENKSWAKQTIAHNTITIDEISQFNGNVKKADLYSPASFFFISGDQKFQAMSAVDENSYQGSRMHRTMILLNDPTLSNPLLIDCFKVESDTIHKYDLPFYYLGQIMKANISFTDQKSQQLGNDFGYQHLRKEAEGQSPDNNSTQITWIKNNKFFTLTSFVNHEDELILTQIGANDSLFNLRRDPGLIIRKNKTKDALFINTLESHGSYSPVNERPINAYGRVDKITVIKNTRDYIAFTIHLQDNSKRLIGISLKDNNENISHQLEYMNEKVSWNGPIMIKKIETNN
ncbi:heparinase II/III domain-containing protein [Marinigracilibium pacificum]|uniref:Alginate lyase family protein n=1 Tax=Marinigracilibium pacificum TaxID=2729599 RepID=A0A848IWI6_9BACT|nr:heparinase II/III family protein [Marinigracilibium pacificum]NMM48883.1 alginate lyase family protein [Marinigracilibium pacificum]